MTSPVVSTYFTSTTATRTWSTAQRTLFDLPIGPAVGSFFLLSAIAHFSMALPARRWYEAHLARGQNPIRWIEYAFSSSVMIVVIASPDRHPGDRHADRDLRRQRRHDPVRLEHGGRQRGPRAAPVAALRLRLHRRRRARGSSSSSPSGRRPPRPARAPIPGFVIAIFVSLFVTFNVFAINMVLQYRKIGRWRDYLYGERAYMLLSLVAKTLLAWQVFAGTLRP